MISASQLPVAAIVTPGKTYFFFDENAGMPPEMPAAEVPANHRLEVYQAG
jgi:hypothetical protein